jgi:parallel beta-helix repeat protein
MARLFFRIGCCVIALSMLSLVWALPTSVTAGSSHGPIQITDDSGFTPANGVTGGSGTAADPFVIQGWSIASTAWVYCIDIANTHAYFVIRDCLLTKGQAGVSLMNVAHGTVQGCTIKGTATGFVAQYASDCRVVDNTIEAQYEGISWFACDRCEASGNVIGVDNQGIEIGDSTRMVLRGNTMTGCSVTIVGYVLEQWNTHVIDTTNTVNRKPVLYYRNASDITVPAGAGQIILGNCTRMSVSGQTLSDLTAGIILGYSSFNKVVSNSLHTNEWACIVLENSDNNLVAQNTVSGYVNGILLLWSKWNTIEGNLFLQKSAGLVLSDSHHSTVTGNVFDKAGFGIYVEWSTDCSFNGNELHGSTIDISGVGPQYWTTLAFDTTNSIDGKPVVFMKDAVAPVLPAVWSELILVSCSQVSIENISMSNSVEVIVLGYCSGVVIANLTNSNGATWIFAQGLTDSTIKDCVFSGIGSGVALFYCTNNKILRDQFVRNYQGLSIYASGFNLIRGCLFMKNLDYAISIYWEESVGNVIYGNAFVANAWYERHYAGESSQAFDYWGTTSWDFEGAGNYWSDWISPDANGDGIVDSPYLIAGPGGAMDDFPLVSSPL